MKPEELKPKVISVIVPVFNVEQYLRSCLDSIVNQTYESIEILLIDDGSRDGCGDICDEYAGKDCRIRVFHTENRGLSAARNLGLQEAKGEYIGFVDSDDWIEPDMYEVLLETMSATGADICTCGCCSESTLSPGQLHCTAALYSREEILTELIHGRIENYVCNKLYRKEMLDGISFPVGRYYEDVDTICKVLSNSRTAAILDTPKYHYRRRSDSITGSHGGKNLMDYADAYLARLNYLKEQQPQLFLENKEEIQKTVAMSFFRVWRWWYGCTNEEREKYADKLDGYTRYSRECFPVFGMKEWPVSLKLSAVFLRHKNGPVFAVLYCLNQMVRRFRA